MESDKKSMTGRSYLLVFLGLILIVAAAGCITYSIGNVAYRPGNLSVVVTNTGDPIEAGIEVRIYTIDGFAQREYITTGTPVSLKNGENLINIPVNLTPGQYKLYVYLTKNGQRETAVIRDIGV
ncbi:MAG: hypothetical protein LUQ31_00340 [Methanoregula sp.]|nr:hypothetical protein [Methanoregula sp.]